MERIKKINEVIVRGDQLWCEVVRKEKKSLIIKPQEADKELIDYLKVIAIGKDIKDVNLGDIIVSMSVPDVTTYNIGDKAYVRVPRNFCDIIVSKDNFDTKVSELPEEG